MELSLICRGITDFETMISLPQKTKQKVISSSYWDDTVTQWVSGHPRTWSMIRGRCEMLQRGWALGASDHQSEMEERMVWQDGQNFEVFWMVLGVRHNEGFWEEFCHLFLKNTIKPYVVLLPNFLVIIMILRKSSPSHRNLTAFLCYIFMCSRFFFSFCSSRKSSQCKRS